MNSRRSYFPVGNEDPYESEFENAFFDTFRTPITTQRPEISGTESADHGPGNQTPFEELEALCDRFPGEPLPNLAMFPNYPLIPSNGENSVERNEETSPVKTYSHRSKPSVFSERETAFLKPYDPLRRVGGSRIKAGRSKRRISSASEECPNCGANKSMGHKKDCPDYEDIVSCDQCDRTAPRGEVIIHQSWCPDGGCRSCGCKEFESNGISSVCLGCGQQYNWNDF